jgi:hypothetical protein
MEALDLRSESRARALLLAVPEALAPAVIETWRGRMINEHRSSHVFEALADQLDRLGQAGDAAECRQFAAEERRHGALCGAVATAAGGEALASVAPPRAVPTHADTSPRAAALRNVLSVGCLSETVAVALIGAERLEMPAGPLRELLDEILADEIGHARFGWRYLARELPRCDAAERDALGRYLPIALAGLEGYELAHIPARTAWPAEGADFGLCDGGDARSLFYDTVAEVILPQLESLGFAATLAWKDRRIA